MLDKALQFSQFKEPPSQFLELLQQPLNVIKSKPNYFYKEYENSPNKFKRLRISTQHEGAVNNIVIDLNIPSPNFRVQQKLDYSHNPFWQVYHDNNITIHSQITSQKTTPKTSRSNSPLKKVYLGSSLVAKRKLNGYVKRKKSPDPYEICRQMTKKIQYKKTETLTIASQTLFLLQKSQTKLDYSKIWYLITQIMIFQIFLDLLRNNPLEFTICIDYLILYKINLYIYQIYISMLFNSVI